MIKKSAVSIEEDKGELIHMIGLTQKMNKRRSTKRKQREAGIQQIFFCLMKENFFYLFMLKTVGCNWINANARYHMH